MAQFRPILIAALLCLLLLPITARAQDDLTTLAADFWRWRALHQPFSGDDIPRIYRPDDTADWSQASVNQLKISLAQFDARWRKLDSSAWPIPRQVDYRLIGSAIARVHWELEIERAWQRNPRFYVDQTTGAVFDALTQPPPFTAERTALVLRRMERIPRILAEAKKNLASSGQMTRPFASLAIESLDDIRPRFARATQALMPLLPAQSVPQFQSASDKAAASLEDYREWLKTQLPGMSEKTAVGRESYLYFLRNVALMPFSPEELLATGRQEWERSVSFEAYEQNRNRAIPALPFFPSAAVQLKREHDQEIAVRAFLQDRRVLSVPDWMQHYRNLPLPSYLAELENGVTDDLTGPARLKENATSYIREPSPKLGYFALATAHDPRPILVHEGVPGHFFQLALGWAHEDPIRRHYYDSGANEGIGFYAEEMMLQAGFFDDSPHTREIIYNFMRLRALRVEVDVKLALGIFTMPQAAQYLEKTVPMDHATSLEEASDFASWPGQAISYQIGKIQILKMLAHARRASGDRFNLQQFHDFVWKNGNVPIALQQWELLNDPSDVPPLAR